MSQKARSHYNYIRDRQEEKDARLCARCNHKCIEHPGEKECNHTEVQQQASGVSRFHCTCRAFVEPKKEEPFALR